MGLYQYDGQRRTRKDSKPHFGFRRLACCRCAVLVRRQFPEATSEQPAVVVIRAAPYMIPYTYAQDELIPRRFRSRTVAAPGGSGRAHPGRNSSQRHCCLRGQAIGASLIRAHRFVRGRWDVGSGRVRGRVAERIWSLTLIVDTAPLVALGDSRDPNHDSVRGILESEPGPLIVPAPVTAEVDYLVRQRGGTRAARHFLVDLAEERFRVEALTIEEYALALAVHDRYAALDLGLADLSVMVLASRYRTTRLLTFDERDFRQVEPLQGGAFTLLPTDM